MKLKTVLGAGCLAAALGCGNGYGINNYEPEQADVVQTADGSYTPADTSNDTQVFNPEFPIPEPRFPRGPFNPGNVDNPTQVQGWGVYCIRKQTPGSTHFGVLANYNVSDADGINEMGLVAYGENTMEKFRQQYPEGVTQAAYLFAKRNFGVNGDEDALALYVIDNDGNDTEFALKRMDCESLDKLLELYGKRQ
ncbi:MAG: hypothetical protein QME12_03195 [Nanoarchaeota archaeon]|nr:hypothetical protein [Nanoarchaeota archaeon]